MLSHHMYKLLKNCCDAGEAEPLKAVLRPYHGGRHGVLARQRARRQRQEQRPVADRADRRRRITRPMLIE
jgi:hypothetical protein